MQILGQYCFQKEYQHNFIEQYTGKTEINLSQGILLMFSKASRSCKRPPGYICSRQTSLVAILRKCFASYFTVFNCFSPGDHYISYHLKKAGWFQVEWQVSLELGLLVLSSAPFQDGSNGKHKCPDTHRSIASLGTSHPDRYLYCSTLLHDWHV